jgi:hypothetical protein
MEAIMDEVTLLAGEGDSDLRERLDQEIIAFNVAATGYGYDHIHLVKRLR